MYTADLEKHKREKEEWKRKSHRLEDQASALQVDHLIRDSQHENHVHDPLLSDR